MTQPGLRQLTLLGLLLLLAMASVQLDNTLSLLRQWQLIIDPASAEAFAEIRFLYAQLPRAVMAVLVGSTLALTGSLMQQLTLNRLTSPMTLGTSAGAWLALVVMNVWFGAWVPQFGSLAAMSGALLAFACVVAITGFAHLASVALVVSGMVINLLLGALAAAIVLLNEQYAQNLFLWGAGDLAQNGWQDVQWLLPRLMLALPVLLFAPRALTLLRLGHSAARARGLPLISVFLVLMALGVWLVSASITMVGLIGFVGLIAPNLAHAVGARSARDELITSLLIGACVLLATDMLAMLATRHFEQLIPSGVTAALIGAPALIILGRRQISARDSTPVTGFRGKPQRYAVAMMVLGLALFMGVLFTVFVSIGPSGWQVGWPDGTRWHLRWPRLLAATAAGVGLAVSGTLLQRVIRNPLASPDMLGVSTGAIFAIIVSGYAMQSAALDTRWLIAGLGSLAVLAILLLLGRRHHYAPASLILTGLALTAMLDSLNQFALASRPMDGYGILLWMAGSTYRVDADRALLLCAMVALLFLLSLSLSRWASLIAIGRPFALARGLAVTPATGVLLSLAALFCAAVATTMGQVVFLGLVAPHVATLLGARSARRQLLMAPLVGAALMVWTDGLGQHLLFPDQIPAGTLVALVGGLYFLCLMLWQRRR